MAKISRKVKILIAIALIAVLAAAVYFYLQQSELPSPLFDNIRWSPEIIRAGQSVEFSLTITNTGIFPASGEVKVYVSKYSYFGFTKPTLAGSFKISLNPYSSASYTYTWTPPEPGFYRLKFVIDGGGSLTQLIYAAPQTRTESSFIFAVFGDNRPADGVQPQPEVFKEIAREVRLIHPDFAVLVGDVIYGYRSDIPRLKMQWSDFLSVYESFGVPVFVAPGNHEMQTEDAPESGNVDAQRLYIMHLGRLYYAFAYGNSLFIVLDTDIVGSAAEISGEQLEWLRNMLEASRSFEHIFVFMHRPVVSYYGANILNNHYEVLPLLLKYNVTAVFQGHNHVYYYEIVNGTRFYVSGGAGAPLYRTPSRGGVNHFLVVEVNGTHVEVKFVPPYSIKVQQEGSKITVDYTFTEPIYFEDQHNSWQAIPKPLTLRGLYVDLDKPEIQVQGGKLIGQYEVNGKYRFYIEATVYPGMQTIIQVSDR